jgi:aminoglycoside phosphotransferase (APT) family kinase protein
VTRKRKQRKFVPRERKSVPREKSAPADPWASAHEPAPEGDDWVECGGELIWAMGFTEGGAPYGLSVSQFRAMSHEMAPRAGWARAKWVLQQLLEAWAGPGSVAEVGWVKKLGEGLSREVFGAEVDIHAHGDTRTDAYVVALPGRDADAELDERTYKELRLLGWLARQSLPFRVPEVIGAYPLGDRRALVCRYIRGIELDLRAGKQGSVLPWQLVGEIAAAIHGLDTEALGGSLGALLPGPATRRAHGLAAVEKYLVGAREPELAAACAWAMEHLPSEQPAVLLHGDLLGQNILLCPGEPPAVVDWEYARLGDPAYDLAVVTRGSRDPFQTTGGLGKLLDVYREHGGDVTAAAVHLHELCLMASWYRQSRAERDGEGRAQQYLGQLRNILRRAERAA